MADLRIRGRFKEGTHTRTHTHAHMHDRFQERTRNLMPYTGHDRFKDECSIFREKFVLKVKREREEKNLMPYTGHDRFKDECSIFRKKVVFKVKREREEKTSCRTRDMTDLRMSVASSERSSFLR